jgi:hypothetical protein
MTWASLCHDIFPPALEVNDHAIYQAATTALDVEQQTLLMEIMRIANEAAAAVASGGASTAGAPPV